MDITIKYLLESFIPLEIDASVSSGTAVKYEILIRILHFILNRSIYIIIDRYYNRDPQDFEIVKNIDWITHEKKLL